MVRKNMIKMMMQNMISRMTILVLVAVLLFSLSACQGSRPNINTNTIIIQDNALNDNTVNNNPDDPIITPPIPSNKLYSISKTGSFTKQECESRDLQDKIIMLLSKYCGHCKTTLPDFEQACIEKGIKPLVLDISVPDQRAIMESFGIEIQFTPTFIFGCDYFIGVKSKEEYSKQVDKFLSEVDKDE